ncbi:hypothetical protein [Streptomyces sioyaensis]|uniref:hypothetical protein n=1 Tax=Streptomyces sioyaensis TaxID=67364 RepID=UPI0037229C8E
MTLFLSLIIVAVVLGIIGAVVAGLGYLLVIAIVLFVATIAVAAQRWSRGKGQGKRRRNLRRQQSPGTWLAWTDRIGPRRCGHIRRAPAGAC